MAPAIEINGLSKRFVTGFLPYDWAAQTLGRLLPARNPVCREVRAVNGVSFSVEPGQVFGLLGPNGAGKTTTIKMLVSLLKPDSGTIRIFGRPPQDPEARRHLGFLPENPYFYEYLKPLEFLDLAGRLAGLDRSRRRKQALELVEQVGLSHALDRPLRKFSKGMLQRIGLAQALMGDPDLVILDEPLSGLDPIGRKEIRELVAGLAAKGKTVLFSSHILSDVEMLCDQVAIMDHGKLLDQGPLEELLARGERGTEVVLTDVPETLEARLRELAERLDRRDKTLVALCGPDPTELVRTALQGGAKLVSAAPQQKTLEDIFVARTKGESNHG